MPLLNVVIILVVVGVLLWALNALLGSYIDAKILKIINVLVVVVVVLWILSLFVGGWNLGALKVGK